MENGKWKMDNKHRLKLSVFICVYLWLISSVFAQQNGKDADWESAGKQGIGTALSENSKVWFTLQGGSLTEVFYPTADKANVQWLQFVVVNPKTKQVERLRDLKDHTILLPTIGFDDNDTSKNRKSRFLCFGSMSFGEKFSWHILQTIIADPESNTIQLQVIFNPNKQDLNLYVYYNPSLNNSGLNDTAWTEGKALLSQDGDISSALLANKPLTEISSGFYGVNDGFEELQKDGKISSPNAKAENGNVAQLAKVSLDAIKPFSTVTFALSFGKTTTEALQTAQTSLKKGFKKMGSQYQKGWADFVKQLPLVDKKYQAQFDYAAMTLRAMEDKTFRGGNVASLSKPWIPKGDANGPYVSGYHLV